MINIYYFLVYINIIVSKNKLKINILSNSKKINNKFILIFKLICYVYIINSH